MTRFDANRGAPDGCLVIVLWVYAVGRIVLAGLGLILVMAYLLQSCGRGLMSY